MYKFSESVILDIMRHAPLWLIGPFLDYLGHVMYSISTLGFHLSAMRL